MLTIDQIKELCERDSQSLLVILSTNPKQDPPTGDDGQAAEERAKKTIDISDEFWSGRLQYRVTWPEGLQARKEYIKVKAEVHKSPDEISPEFKGFVRCLIASGIVTKAVLLLFNSPPERHNTETIVGTIVSVATACFVSNPITPHEFTENVLKAFFSSRWGSWG
jgi:hypothetical protein